VRPVTLTVISDDAALIALCREALRDFSEASNWELRVESSYESIPPDGICLIDYKPGQKTPIAFDTSRTGIRYFFLVRPKELEQFREAIPSARGNILLKPVSRAVLDAYFSSAISSSEASSLRAQRDELLQGLLEANLRLQEYDQQRTNYLARAVHEFRVPLTAINGFLGLLSSGELGSLNSNQVEALLRMRHGVGIMTRLTSTMLELSIAGQREREPQLREGRIEECVDQVVKTMEPVAQEKDLRIVLNELLPPGGPLLFERAQIEQVLINLLDNACRASPRRGKIEISGYPYFWERRFLAPRTIGKDRRRQSTPESNSYRIDIRDSGPGIRPEHLETIFEEYTSYSGTQDPCCGGLGLAICRSILQRHHGQIWAKSQTAGSLFSFVLPFREFKQSQASRQLNKKATA
jgi:signal transduction histidine kinase